MGASAVALRYAEALYELGQEEDRSSAILQDLAALKASLDGDPEGFAKLMHPRVETAEKNALLSERFLPGRDPLVQNMLRLLVKRRRTDLLRDFFRCYLDVHEEREGILRVEIETASHLEAEAAQSVRQQLVDATGKRIVLEARVQPELLGGMRFKVGSHLLDGSVRRRLEKIERGLRSVPLDA